MCLRGAASIPKQWGNHERDLRMCVIGDFSFRTKWIMNLGQERENKWREGDQIRKKRV